MTDVVPTPPDLAWSQFFLRPRLFSVRRYLARLRAGSRAMLQRHPRHRLRAVRRLEAGRHDAGLQRQPLRHPRRGHRDACAHECEA